MRCLLLMAVAVAAMATPLQAATVVAVTDGDTLTVREGGKSIRVRLACVDAPELTQRPHGAAARGVLMGLLPIGSTVTLRNRRSGGWGRTAAEVERGNLSINQTLVRQGNAFVYWDYISGCDRQTYQRLENEAKANRRGIWSVPTGIERPWNYRRDQ